MSIYVNDVLNDIMNVFQFSDVNHYINFFLILMRTQILPRVLNKFQHLRKYAHWYGALLPTCPDA